MDKRQFPMNTDDSSKERYPSSKNLFIWGSIFFFVTVLLSICAPKLITENTLFPLDTNRPNEIGDTIGGILGPIVGLIAAALTFLAFWAQFDANIQQRKQFDLSFSNEKAARRDEEKRISDQLMMQQNEILRQDKSSKINLFETRFYTMLSIHRDNANNIEVHGVKGQKVFLHMLDELKLIYNLFMILNKKEKGNFSPEHIYNVSYLTFFFGVGKKSTPMVKDLVGEKLVGFIEKSHMVILNQIEKNKNDSLVIFEINGEKLQWEKYYGLGVGHLRRLGHYVRHLFQAIKFVDEQNSDLLDYETKYKYIANLRAQLSAHEQIMLFYNAISVMGEPWLDILEGGENYIERYCIIKSIPINAADFYKIPAEFFSSKNAYGKSMFEWVEIKERMQKLS